MNAICKEADLSLDALIAIAEELQAKHRAAGLGGEMAPFELLCGLSAHVLAAHIPAHRDTLLAREHSQIEQTFACEILRLNDLPASMWLDEDRQRELFGGVECLLFKDFPPGLFEHYAKLFGRRKEDDDPLTWDAAEV